MFCYYLVFVVSSNVHVLHPWRFTGLFKLSDTEQMTGECDHAVKRAMLTIM